ncbi:MAG: hypothetical protein J5449_07730, partial [Oscillospiraceae bacterium]|nr:hypothetical protein [Oscillospiraceae bacterium]
MNLNQRRLRARSLLLTLVMLAALSPAAVLPAGAAASAMWNEGEDVTITDNTNYGSVTVFGSGNAVILTIPSVMTVLKADSIELNGSPLTFDGIGTLNVTGNIFNGSPSYYGMTMHGGMMTVGGSINLENNCFTLNGGTLSVTGSMGDVELCGGTLTAGSYSGKVFAPGPYLISDGDGYSVIAVDEYGYMTDVADAGEKTLTPAVASVTEGGTPHYYPTLQSAVDAAAGAGSAEAPGMVTLLYDVLLSDPLTVGAGCSVTLDLNGHAVDRGLTGRRSEEAGCVVRVSGSLEITDSSAKNADKTDGKGKITGGSNGDFDGGGVCVCGNGSFTLSGGSVIGNAASHGGGVFVGENGSFMMTGGSITGNSAVYGSVYVDRNGSFTLSGGSINGNSAKTGGGVYVNGNGANAGGSFTLSGGRITGNSANAGGGVHVHLGGRLFVSGSPKITGNVKYAEGTTTYENGLYTGGADDDLYLPDSETVIVVTGALTGGDRSVGVKTGFLGTFARASDENNEGETVTYELTDTDAGYFFSDAEGASVERGGSELKISTLWMALQSLLDAGGEVTLDQNFTAIEADRILVIPADKSVTLDLNGHTIDRALSGAEKTVKDGGVIKVEGSLTLTDGSEDKTGTITGGNSSAGGGVYVCMGGVLTVTGGTITGCTANSGGGVYVDGGELRMSGCAVISGNSAGSLGGGVCLCKGAAFTMEGGTIRGNGAVGNGGG